MEEKYTEEVLRAATGHICQIIGFTNAQGSALEILQDVLQRFLREFALNLRRKVEHNNRILAVPRDMIYVLNSLNLNPEKLQHYVLNVEGEGLPVEVPKFPVPKSNQLRFLPSDSKENAERPEYMYAYLPSTHSHGDAPVDGVVASNSFNQNEDLTGEATENQNLEKNLMPNVMQIKETNDLDAKTTEKNLKINTGITSDNSKAPDEEYGNKAYSHIPEDLYDLWGRDDPPTPAPPPPPTPPVTEEAPKPVEDVAHSSKKVERDKADFIKTESKKDINLISAKNLGKNKNKLGLGYNIDAFEKKKLKKQKKLSKLAKIYADGSPNLPLTAVGRSAENKKLFKKQVKKQKLGKRGMNTVGVPNPVVNAMFDVNATRFNEHLSNELLTHSHSSGFKIEKKYSPPRFTGEQPELAYNADIGAFKQEHINTPVRFAEPPNVFPNSTPIAFPPNDSKVSTNELDQNKLNIFKKISKQKPKATATVPAAMGHNEMPTIKVSQFAENPSSFINLPSGTTITPTTAPPAPKPFVPTVTPSNFATGANMIRPMDAVQPLTADIPMEYKPKKRGRKPGSKNQPKNKIPKQDNFGFDAKKFRTDSVNLANMPYPLNFAAQSANKDLGNTANMFNQFPLTSTSNKLDFYANNFMLNTGNQLINTMGLDSLKALTPNNLLPPMGTPQIQQFLPSFIAPGNNKLNNAFLPTSESSPLAPNKAPSFPMFIPFTSKPGLIPTGSGLFPPHNLTDFSSIRPNNSATNMDVLSSFMPSSNFNSFSTDKFNLNDGNNIVSSEKNLAGKLPLESNKGFCNVPPLVPENMKFLSIEKVTKDNIGLPENKALTAQHTLSAQNNINKTFSSASISKPNTFGAINLSTECANIKNLSQMSHMATGNIDDPIEVSDDSVDLSVNKQQINAPNIPQPLQLNISENKLNTQTNVISPSALTLKNPKTEATDFYRNLDLNHHEKFGLSGGVELIPLPNKTDITPQLLAQYPQFSQQFSLTPTTLQTEEPPKFMNYPYDPITITTTNQTVGNTLNKTKEHKKMKKSKDIKIKKKKDKKDKSKNRDRSEDSSDKGSKADRDLEKRLKKEKKKEKQRLQMASAAAQLNPKLKEDINFMANNDGAMMNSSNLIVQTPTVVAEDISLSNNLPKITLKLNSAANKPFSDSVTDEITEPVYHSPPGEASHPGELARFSPLVTRPPKQKHSSVEPHITKNKSIAEASVTPSVPVLNPTDLLPPANNWQSGATLSASSVLLPQQLSQKAISTEPMIQPTAPAATPKIKTPKRVSCYYDVDGTKIWICPACGKVDDGSPMVACDGGCEDWFHWVCVGIFSQDDLKEKWFCTTCTSQTKKSKKKQK